ncbi:hypothetical protein [Mesorhizobium sp.]|uniref:hypothetical protein n=1 Tax=Mesorhizobium sp. TaxID=1871066 RepID=UPI00257A6EC4|nr:hypothetical protein [Mesorhizobium sp.]
MTLAFRLYGRFRWPPSPAKLGDGEQSGVVEIYYLPGEDGKQRAALAWLPKGPRGKIPAVTNAPKEKPPEVPPADPVAYFGDGGKAKTIWLDTSAGDDWLAFRGAFLIEQYHKGDDGKAKLDLRLPLANGIGYAKGNQVFSGVRIGPVEKGADKVPAFGLRLHFPLPVDVSEDWSVPAFPVSARYLAAVEGGQDFSKIERLEGGWFGETVGGAGFAVWLKHHAVSTFRLGKFGLSEQGSDQLSDYVSYAANIHHKPKTDDVETYWRRNSRCFGRDLLRGYGFDQVDGPYGTYKGDYGPAENSLRFERSPSSEVVTGLTYRTRVGPGFAPGAGSDFLRVGSAFQVRLRGELGGQFADAVYFKPQPVDGWLRLGDKVSADGEVAWDISDVTIWSENPSRDWAPKVTLRLHWQETLPETKANEKLTGVETGPKQKPFEAGLIAKADFAFDAARKAMLAGEAGLPHSFLPKLGFEKGQTVRFMLHGSPIAAAIDGNGLLSWGRSLDKNAKPTSTEPWKRPPMRLTLADPDKLIAGELEKPEAATTLELTASGMTFFENPDTKFTLHLSHDPEWPPTSVDSVEDGQPFFASFAARTVAAAEGWNGRLASLKFEAKGKLDTGTLPDREELHGHLRIGGAGARDGYGPGGPELIYPNGRIATEFRIVVPVSTVSPISVDVARFDRTGRAAPLLIPLGETGDQTEGRYWLSAIETLSATHDRQLRADIIENTADIGNRSYAVLSSEPFSIFRFTHQPLSDRGRADTASVAVYSGDDRIWQFRKVSQYYHYTLPPQSIGESADKPRRLEIHDLPEPLHLGVSPPLPIDGPPRPFDLIWKTDETGKIVLDEAASNLRRRAVEQRLTPPAEIWIAPSDVERGYFMPEATSYEIFRQAGAYGLGAALAFLRAEFLYGMPVGVDVSKEGGNARGARVAEIEALVGGLAGGARERDADRNLSSRWDALRAAAARRPERLEVWARDLGSTIDFTPAKFSDGVRFALRTTALHRPALLDRTVPGAETEDPNTWPTVGVTAPTYGLEETRADQPNKPRTHPQGLSGGALWPVESLNLLNTLLENPASVGGTIEQIALSPLGGDAAQKAEFLNGQVAIISETRNGRVQRQQVEVIGRICALWHRAKHVVVYERTVNPSAQFAPKFEEDEGRTRSRRPILRKVREYIELLQPERGYPDFSTATQRSAGFLERARFNSRIINVDSAWSSEVDKFGWQIPLWNRQAARERPQVYPMPDIAFVSTAEGDSEKPSVAQDCRDTDMLFFFADFLAGTSDTDQWPSRLGLDYANLPSAGRIAKVVDAASSAQPAEDADYGSDRRRKAVSRFLPGVRRFTWRLAPAAQKTAINAGRAGKPVYVGLDSVSFMRAGNTEEGRKEISGQLKNALDTKGVLPADLGLGYWLPDGTGVAAELTGLADMVKTNGSLTKIIQSGDTNDIGTAIQDLHTELIGSAKNGLVNLAQNAKLGEFNKLKSGITSGALCAKLKDDAVGLIKRKEMLITSALQDWLAKTDELLEAGQEILTKAEPRQWLVDELTRRAIEYIRPLFEEATQDVARIEESVEKARAILVDVDVEIDLVIARAGQRVEQFKAGYSNDVPWSPDRRKAFRNGVEACIGSVVADISVAIDEAAMRLATELNNASQSLAGHVAKFLKQVACRVVEGKFAGKLASLARSVDVLVARLDAKLDELEPNAESATGKLDELLQMAGKLNEPPKADVVKALTAAQVAVGKGQVAIAKLRSAAADADKIVDDFADSATTAVGSLVKNLNNIGQDIVAATKTLVDLPADGLGGLKTELEAVHTDMLAVVDAADAQIAALASAIGTEVDAVVLPAMRWLDETLAAANAELRKIPDKMLPIIDDISGALQAVKEKLAPTALLDPGKIVHKLIRNALESALQSLPNQIDPAVAANVVLLRKNLQFLTEDLTKRIRNAGVDLLDELQDVTDACRAVSQGVAEVEQFFEGVADATGKYFEKEFEGAYKSLKGVYDQYAQGAKTAEELIAAVKDFDRKVRAIHNDLARVKETAEAYADRVFDAAGKLDDGGLFAAPNNVLKLYSAVTSAPELAALKADIDRIRSAFDELGDIIETTKANALFDRLNDELKAIGLSLPFDKIGDSLVPADLRDFNIGSVFRNFGGAKLDKLFKGYRIPEGVRDAVKVTHDFDKKQARAWVQVDINAPFPGRKSLFSLGIFKADFVDMQLTGRVRLEASKDTEKVTVTGFGRIGTVIDAVVAGQSMVRFEKFGLAFTKENGLDIEFDPKNVRLNPQFKFIQDFLSAIFPELPGGLEWIKENGIPVGVQHDFAIPNLSLTFATSGVSNISLENHFRLVAFPDFMLSNRFNLSTVERPFIFSIFIIGGSGYIQVEAEYKPIRDELTVLVDAGAGGSAQLAFAFGPFVGQVYITLSGVLSYRKTIGKPGGGLSIAVVLVIAGHVDVAGIVTVGITLMLRMTYRDSGQIDADGSLSVTIRITRFFKLTARAQVKYKLRGGKSETVVSTNVKGELDKDIAAKAKALEETAKKVEGAMK